MKGEVKVNLYEEIAERIISLIDQGVLKEGDKIPSIRELSSRLGVSLNTVKESFWHLENRNYIHSVPQSGYYVKNLNGKIVKTGSTDPVLLSPVQVSLCRIYNAIQQDGCHLPQADLGIATVSSDLWPVEKVRKAARTVLQEDTESALHYCMSPGNRILREQISLLSMKSGFSVAPEEIVITSGCMEGVYLALNRLCRPGDTVAIETPIFFSFFQLAENMGLHVIEIPNSRGEGISFDLLRFVLDRYDIKAFVGMPNFSNPTGGCMSDAHKEQLVGILEEAEVPLIEDDIYADIFFGEKRPKPCKAFDTSGNVILCSSFSKVIAPGFRVGWIVPGRFYPDIENSKHLLNIGGSSLEQMIISQFLQTGGFDRHVRKLRHSLQERVQEMKKHILETFPPGTSVSDPEGGFVLWIEVDESIDTLELYEILIKKDIIIAPGATFSASGKYSNFLRLNAGVWNEEIAETVTYIGETLFTMMGRR